MAWTMVNLEQAVIDRAEGYFDFLTWNKTADGTNSFCAGPIRDAILFLEYSVTTLSQPADADLALIAAADTLKVLEVADLIMHQTILSSLATYVDIQVAQRDEKLSQIAERLEMQIYSKEKALQKKYGLWYGIPQAVKIDYNFMQKNDDPAPTNS